MPRNAHQHHNNHRKPVKNQLTTRSSRLEWFVLRVNYLIERRFWSTKRRQLNAEKQSLALGIVPSLRIKFSSWDSRIEKKREKELFIIIKVLHFTLLLLYFDDQELYKRNPIWYLVSTKNGKVRHLISSNLPRYYPKYSMENIILCKIILLEILYILLFPHFSFL